MYNQSTLQIKELKYEHWTRYLLGVGGWRLTIFAKWMKTYKRRKLKISWAGLLIKPRCQANTKARNRCPTLAQAQAKSGTHSHCLFSVTSPQGAVWECGHFYLEWDKFQRRLDAQVRHNPRFISSCLSPRSGPSNCVIPHAMATELVWVTLWDKWINVIFWGQQKLSWLWLYQHKLATLWTPT